VVVPPVASAPAQVAASAPNPVSISQYGDSTTVGYYKAADGTYQILADGPVQMLQTALQAQYGPSVTVLDYAVGGGAVQDLIDGTGVFKTKLSDLLKTDPSQIATIRFGLNDENAVDPATFKASLVAAVQLMQAAGKTVVIEELTPTTNYIYAHGQDYATAADEASQQLGAALVKSYSLTLAIPNWISEMSDLQHPTAPLYQSIVAEQIPTLQPLIVALEH
jgi:lysophospholipase L1-like esterase